jgi:hypothetical protein
MRAGGMVENIVSSCQLKTCQEKCEHESIIRTYFGIECLLPRSTILISVSLNAAIPSKGLVIFPSDVLRIHQKFLFPRRGPGRCTGFLTKPKGHFVVVQEHDVCYWTSFRGFSPEDFQLEPLLCN